MSNCEPSAKTAGDADDEKLNVNEYFQVMHSCHKTNNSPALNHLDVRSPKDSKE